MRAIKRCCCFGLKNGCVFIGCLYGNIIASRSWFMAISRGCDNHLTLMNFGVKAVITALVASYSAYEGHINARKAETEEYRRLNTAIEITSIIMAVFKAAEIVCNILLLKGVFDSKPKLIFPWMVLCTIDLIFSSFLFISAVVLAVYIEFQSDFIWTHFAEPINIGMNIYFHLVVHSYYKQVKSIAPDVSETASRQPSALSVMKPYPSQPATPLAQYILQVPTLPSIHYPPQKKVSTLDKHNSTEHFGSTVSWVEKI